MNTAGVPLLTQEERRRRITKLFEEGLTYSQIRNEMAASAFDFPDFEAFLTMIGASSEGEYRRIHASIERTKAVRERAVSIRDQERPVSEDEEQALIRKKVLESNLGACLFCDRNAEEVHHVLGQEERTASKYLLPVCPEHHAVLSGQITARDGQELRGMAARMALIYPRLYLTVRKTIRTEDGDVVSYAVVRIQNREQAVAKDDPCPGWQATVDTDEADGVQGCAILSFHIAVSETGFDTGIRTMT
ncbi:MAG: hypothetical protein GXX95_09045 [Methanomassiliicoccus sp.]|nr:hypothetical protein [Methanomassiliicoccus sp.]